MLAPDKESYMEGDLESLRAQLLEQETALTSLLELCEESPEDEELREMQAELQGLVQELETKILAIVAAPKESINPDDIKIGCTCRFRHTDGCWYLGEAMRETPEEVFMKFVRPTKSHMLSGISVIRELIEPHQPPPEGCVNLQAGQKVLALKRHSGLWEQAELCNSLGENWSVIFCSDGFGSTVHNSEIEPCQINSEYGVTEDHISEDSACSSDEDELLATRDGQNGANEGEDSANNVQLAAWEDHTRRIGSQMMIKMGYKLGQPLGSRQKGIVQPLQVDKFKSGAGLGLEGSFLGPAHGTFKRSKRKRGGKKARRRDLAKAAFQERQNTRDADLRHELETGDTGVFALVNSRLGDTSDSAQKIKAKSSEGDRALKQNVTAYFGETHKSKKKETPQSRKGLISGQEEIAAAQAKVSTLKEMAFKNTKDLIISKQVAHKLHTAEKELRLLRDKHASSISAVQARERQKSWLKF